MNSQSENMRRLWANNPDRKAKASQTMSETAKRLWKNPKFKRTRLAVMRVYWKSDVWRRKQSKRITKAWNSARRLKASKISKDFWADPIWRQKQIQIFQKSFRDPAHRLKVSLRARSPKSKKRSSELFRRLWESPAFRKKKILELKRRWAKPEEKHKFVARMRKLWADQHYRDKITRIKRADGKKLWADPEYRERQTRHIVESRKQRPTSAETKLQQLLRHLCPSEFKYNGDRGDIILAGHIPDFININGKKQLIEMFGCYWHGCKTCGHRNVSKNKTDQRRLEDFHRLGWDTLVVWEHELNAANLERKITAFVN